MTQEKIFIINATKEYYAKYERAPSQRALLEYIKSNNQNDPKYCNIDSIWLLKLFYDPDNSNLSTMQKLIELAGLPEAISSCI